MRVLSIKCRGDTFFALRRDLAEQQRVSFASAPDDPPLQRGSGLAHYWCFLTDLVGFARRLCLLRDAQEQAAQEMAERALVQEY